PGALRDEAVDDARHGTAGAPTPSMEGASDGRAVSAIIEALSTATRPVFFVASDLREAGEQLAAVASVGRVPILVPAPHRGVVPEDHPWTLCCDDQRTAFDRIQDVVDSADLVILLGAKLSHVATAGFRLRLDPRRVACISDNGASLPHGYSARTV